MKDKILIICRAFLWCFVILLFPIASGTISVIFSMNIIETLFLQGSFMAMSLIVPTILVLCGKWRWREIGFAKLNLKGCKKVLYFIPLLVILVPVLFAIIFTKTNFAPKKNRKNFRNMTNQTCIILLFRLT